MSSFQLRLCAVFGTALFFVASLWVNQEIFVRSEFVRGVNWVYLPAGIRLLSTLLFGADGALGLLFASWVVNFFYFFPNDPVRSFAGGIIATAAPYAMYRLARELYGLNASLSNLTAGRLMILTVAYALAGPLLHNIWFWLQGDRADIVSRFFAMFIGDLCGTMIVIYTLKVALHFLPVPRRSEADSHSDR
ncbi:hypothetical protein AWB79_06510 [Caballeronia hypogeia]|uniref:MASE1 domain-containing protein n=1 Tax=Caballeronia hypogeia TaxID=1777140 RepID=A0A158D610_9BURK|nr:hypothetical protein [Caballeronia hypogeia]SAK90028.1 hypothetical protein AWB79_06510 [Caballeronia hypogeia]